ncbi:hypothetical protein [Hyalangium versicolor]|uniref:hypothetical protein n=1 Tax=Hyalangium versicolor TaxID=2861190 RepID=UPI001CC9A4C9|nr:hypothetical protein [Hyalangium versicolor]
MGIRKLLMIRPKEAPPKQESPLSLQLLLPKQIGISADRLVEPLHKLHPSLAQVRAEVRSGAIAPNVMQMGRVRWKHHVVQITLVDAPMVPEAMENTVAISHYGDDLKTRALAHVSHIVLLYRGEEKDPLEQYVALAMIAVGLVPLGAFVVVNASAYTSFPLQPLVPHAGGDVDKLLRSLPLPSLFVGFVTMQVVGWDGIWVRTCGAPLMNLPDLALHVRGTGEIAQTRDLFNAMLHTMRDVDTQFGEGDMVQDGDQNWMLRRPRVNEQFLDSPRMLVLVPQH